MNDEGMGDVTHKGMGLPNLVPGIYNVTPRRAVASDLITVGPDAQ